MCCCGCGSCCSRSAVLFKLSIMGVFFAFIMTLLGLIYPFNMALVSLPISWVLGILVLLPSITAYYEVKDKFWAEAEEAMKKEKASKKSP